MRVLFCLGYQVKVLEFFDCPGPRQGVEDLRELLHKVKVLEFFDCPGPRQGVEDLRELLHKRSTQQCMKSVVAKYLGVAGIQQQNGLVDETNVTLFAKVRVQCRCCMNLSLERLGDHTFEVEPQENVDQGAGLQEVQTQDLMDCQLARDRDQHLACELFGYREDSNESAFAVAAVEKIYAHESLTFNNTVACEVIFKWKAGLKDDMDAQLDLYVLSNGYDMGFSCGCKAEIWATKGLLDKAKGNVLGMKIVRDQSGYTPRVSQSRFYNRKLVQTLLEGHFILSLEGSLSGDYDVEKNGKWSCIYAVGSQEYQMVCMILDIASADVGYGLMILGCAGSLKANLQDMKALSTTEAGYMTFTEAWKKKIWPKRLLTESRYELRLVAGIATGALVKGGSRSEVPAQVEVAAYRY
nr:zinc finger, CCHC-type [Tanacetum cinerariifolium]